VFTWIKAHAENSGNELADQLAKDAVNNNVICFNKVPKSEILREEKPKVLSKVAKTVGYIHQRTGYHRLLP